MMQGGKYYRQVRLVKNFKTISQASIPNLLPGFMFNTIIQLAN